MPMTRALGAVAVAASLFTFETSAESGNTGRPPTIINWESPGNLAATNPLGCVAPETISASDTAADIASGARSCLDERDYDRMADLILFASAYAFYDTLRVFDPSAHAALGALFVDRFESISRSQRRRFLRAVDQTKGNEKRVGELCAMLSAVGPPRYHPTYMIAHGLMSFPGVSKAAPQLREIDRAEGWRKTLVEFVMCPGEVKIESFPSDIHTSAEDETTSWVEELFRDQLRSGGEGPEMVVMPAGRFRMGCVSDRACRASEKPAREVTIPAPFALSVHEVTFEDYDRFMRPDRVEDQAWGRGNRPVIHVSWDDAKAYVAWLSSETGAEYRLPSEAEWEYAARARSETKYGWGNDIGSNRANCLLDFCGDPWENTAPAGSFGANAWSLHDMHGNVQEWVEDCWNPNYSGAPSDGSAWLNGNCAVRVLRGGSSFDGPRDLRAAARSRLLTDRRNRDVGFRVARTLTP